MATRRKKRRSAPKTIRKHGYTYRRKASTSRKKTSSKRRKTSRRKMPRRLKNGRFAKR
jgi:hypothetical protein